MNYEISKQTVLVPLPVAFVEALLNMRAALDDDLVSILETSVGESPAATASPSCPPNPKIITPERGKYTAEFLGDTFAANTLAEMFGRIVDITAEVAPEVLVSLAELRTRERRYIAQKRDEIHPHSSHLPVMQVTSGWWISKCISQPDLKRAFRALCRVSGLSFGKDMKFPAHQSV